jgi:hypothetical protein
MKRNFKIYELVDRETYETFGLHAWRFIDKDLINVLDFIRNSLDRKITINNWYWSGEFEQRGLRTNVSEIVKDKTMKDELYLSAHVLGKAADFDVEGMSAEEVRKWLSENKLPVNVRVENSVNWVHLDTINMGGFYVFG